jgi:hypothetical protein
MPRTRLLALLLILLPAALGAQSRAEVIRGRVTTDSGAVVTGATVSATMAPDRLTRSTRTDAEGRYEIHFPEGRGDYLLHVTPAGRSTVRKRVVAGADPVLVVDVRLPPPPKPVALEALQVRAARQRPQRGAEQGTGTGASETLADGVAAALAPDEAGDVAATAATVPGITLTPLGISALGLGPGQNQVTLNGLAFAGSALPRDARTRTRVSTSTYDPARGGFSGAQVALELAPGNDFEFRRGHVVLDAPQLQHSDHGSGAVGERFTGFRASAGGDGPLVENQIYYNAAAQIGRRASEGSSLLDGDEGVYERIGVPADSVARLIALLDRYRVPGRVGSGSLPRITEEGSFVARIDRTPYGKKAAGITAYAQLRRAGALAVTPMAPPSYGGRSTSAVAGVQAQHSVYFGAGTLNETRTSLSVTSSRSTPYAAVPGGRVLVASSPAANSRGGSAWLQFGGNGTLDSSTRAWTWETSNELVTNTPGHPHRLKLAVQSRLDGYSQSAGADRLGTFTFSSLGDLEANRPASFTRVLAVPERTGTSWSGALSLGDQWRPVPTLQLVHGVRLEGNHFFTRPGLNPEVLSAFGARTDHAPNALHLSPRLGFTWMYGRSKSTSTATLTNAFGTFFRGPTGIVRGGAGEFSNLLVPTLLSEATASTGLPGSMERLLCVGPAAPVPDWAAYAADPGAVPRECLASASAPPFSDAAPGVELFDRGYTAPRSWRANLAWVASFRKVLVSAEGTVSLNLNQPGYTDLNFSGVPRFLLAEEGGRPVYVDPGAIDPRTGAVAPAGGRIYDAFGSVVSHRSDLRSRSGQFTLSATPRVSPGTFFNLSYTLSGVRAQAYGFGAVTFGDPRERGWARADHDVRHQVLLQGGITVAKGFTLTLFGRLASGAPYTPLLGADVNGDGRVNDRAFVAAPEALRDAELATGMTSLLSSSGRVRGCLAGQLGEAARRNSCTGPWTQSLNARIALSNRLLRTSRRINAAINLTNPLGGLDRLLHGSEGARGWGSVAVVDPVLYTVRGFDPDTRAFRYAVNPHFGETHHSFRVPFRVTLDIALDLGAPLQLQQLRRMLNQGRGGRPGARLTPDSLQHRYARTVPSLYRLIVQESDSLLLTPDQVRELTAADSAYQERANVVWAELAAYLGALGDHYDRAEALRRSEVATDRVWALAKEEGPRIKAILSPLQYRLAPGTVRYVLDTNEKIRYFFQ